METFIPWTLVKRGVRRQVITPIDAPLEFAIEATLEKRERKTNQDTPLLRVLGLAHYWQRLLDDGKYRSLTEIAIAECMDRGQANRIALMTRLAPEIIHTCISNRRVGATIEPLAKASRKVIWEDQSSFLAMKMNDSGQPDTDGRR
jgi:hypothetical protein